MNDENTQQKVEVEQEYFFPTYGKTVVATSREEAEQKVQALLDETKN